jgi:hypothetical protein
MKTMANKKTWLGILVMALVFAMAVIGCAVPEEENGEIDPALNGTWVSVINSDTHTRTFNDGNWELSRNGNPQNKGTYTTKDGKVYFTISQIYGNSYTHLGPELAGLGWLTKQEVLSAGKVTSSSLVDSAFESFNNTYSVAGDTLTLGAATFTKTPQ